VTDQKKKIARAKYVESQNRLRRETLNKRLEKDSGKLIDDLIWGVPKGSKSIAPQEWNTNVLTRWLVEAQGLKDFWQENFRVQVEAQSGALRIHHEDGKQLFFFFHCVNRCELSNFQSHLHQNDAKPTHLCLKNWMVMSTTILPLTTM
jgi:hypothetical protein